MEKVLKETITAFETGELDKFKDLARQIYNAFSCYPSNLSSVSHKYLLGQIFSDYAPFIENNINAYTTALENAYFCLASVVINSEYISQKNCAAIRLLLLIDENRQVMLHIASRFIKERSSRVSHKPAINVGILNSIMNNAFDEEVLRIVGGFLINEISSSEKKSFIPQNEMYRYNMILQKNCYNTKWSLFDATPEEVFLELYNYILYVINEPYERRMTPLW